MTKSAVFRRGSQTLSPSLQRSVRFLASLIPTSRYLHLRRAQPHFIAISDLSILRFIYFLLLEGLLGLPCSVFSTIYIKPQVDTIDRGLYLALSSLYRRSLLVQFPISEDTFYDPITISSLTFTIVCIYPKLAPLSLKLQTPELLRTHVQVGSGQSNPGRIPLHC